MTHPTKRTLERRLDDADDSPDDRMFAVSIGGDPDAPTGWLSPDEYEQYYGDLPDSTFEFHIEPTDQ